MEGYCYDCAKAKGMNPNEVLKSQNNILNNNQNLSDMSKQFEGLFKDLAENINLEDIQNIEGAITFDGSEENDDDENEDIPKISGAAIPLGSLFSSMFGGKAVNLNVDKENQEEAEPHNGRKKVKVEKKNKKQKNKKKELNG